MNGRLIWRARVYNHAPALLIQMCAHLPLHWHGLNFEANLGAAETLIRAHTTRQLPN